jgi:hypothetical protein
MDDNPFEQSSVESAMRDLESCGIRTFCPTVPPPQDLATATRGRQQAQRPEEHVGMPADVATAKTEAGTSRAEKTAHGGAEPRAVKPKNSGAGAQRPNMHKFAATAAGRGSSVPYAPNSTKSAASLKTYKRAEPLVVSTTAHAKGRNLTTTPTPSLQIVQRKPLTVKTSGKLSRSFRFGGTTSDLEMVSELQNVKPVLPSKLSHMPNVIVDLWPCASTAGQESVLLNDHGCHIGSISGDIPSLPTGPDMVTLAEDGKICLASDVISREVLYLACEDFATSLQRRRVFAMPSISAQEKGDLEGTMNRCRMEKEACNAGQGILSGLAPLPSFQYFCAGGPVLPCATRHGDMDQDLLRSSTLVNGVLQEDIMFMRQRLPALSFVVRFFVLHNIFGHVWHVWKSSVRMLGPGEIEDFAAFDFL